MRDLQLVLLEAGGAELVDVESESTVWSSDGDNDFREEFPEVLSEDDLEHIIDYLEAAEVIDDREAETLECMSDFGEEDELDGDFDDDEDDDLEEWEEDETEEDD
jgi:hypothetical protein